jgi:predicted DNA-binding antitoxin AbrB/MazE fold protein
MPQMMLATAVYQDGVLKLQAPLPALANGDRVEVVVVRVVPIDRDAPEEVARRERLEKEYQDRIAALPPDAEGDYEEECRAMDENRGGGRKLFPPEMQGITW